MVIVYQFYPNKDKLLLTEDVYVHGRYTLAIKIYTLVNIFSRYVNTNTYLMWLR